MKIKIIFLMNIEILNYNILYLIFLFNVFCEIIICKISIIYLFLEKFFKNFLKLGVLFVFYRYVVIYFRVVFMKINVNIYFIVYF